MRRALSLMAVLLVAATGATAGDTKGERETLKGLLGMCVLVEGLTPEAEADGLSESAIRTDVELKLRQTGIKVLTQAETFAVPGSPALYIRVSTLRSETGPVVYAFFIEVNLYQDARLERDARIRAIGAVTWSASGQIGTAGRAKLQQIRDNVQDAVDKFINAWLSVNPKQ